MLKKIRNRQLDGAIKKLICTEKRFFLLSRQGYVFELKLPWRRGSRRPQTDFLFNPDLQLTKHTMRRL